MVAVGTPVTGRPRTDPYERDYRIRLLPWVMTRSAGSDEDGERGPWGRIGRQCGRSDPTSCCYAGCGAEAHASRHGRPQRGTSPAASGYVGGYAGDKLRHTLANLGTWTIEIVKRSDAAKGFVLLPRRWVVERTLAWLNRNRRLAKDFEATVESAVTWLYIASVKLMSRRLARV